MDSSNVGSLIIAPKYLKEEYEIFKVSESKLEELLATPQSYIKDSTLMHSIENRPATLSTNASTFDLIKLESSNLLLLTKKQDKDYIIYKQDKHVIEMEIGQASKGQIWELMKREGIYYDGQSEFAGVKINSTMNKGIRFEEILSKCQTSEEELKKILEDLNAFELNGKLFIFDSIDSIYRTKSLLLELHKVKPIWSSIGREVIKPFLDNLPENAANSLLNVIFEYKDNSWSLNERKAKIFCAMLLFNEKQNYILKEFIVAFNKVTQTLLPPELLRPSTEDWKTQNLFPGYPETDLRFLNKTAIITFDKKEPIIEYVDYLSLSDNLKKRFTKLGSVKKEWTKQELQHWLDEYVPSSQNLDTFLAKNGRMQSIAHPFISKGKVQIYIPK